MTRLISASHTWSDQALVSEVSRLAGEERRATAQLVAALAEFDARRLYLPAGCSSMFTYCTQVLHLSEHAAYNRHRRPVPAARATRIPSCSPVRRRRQGDHPQYRAAVPSARRL